MNIMNVYSTSLSTHLNHQKTCLRTKSKLAEMTKRQAELNKHLLITKKRFAKLERQHQRMKKRASGTQAPAPLATHIGLNMLPSLLL